jgi:hypothetical protein
MEFDMLNMRKDSTVTQMGLFNDLMEESNQEKLYGVLETVKVFPDGTIFANTTEYLIQNGIIIDNPEVKKAVENISYKDVIIIFYYPHFSKSGGLYPKWHVDCQMYVTLIPEDGSYKAYKDYVRKCDELGIKYEVVNDFEIRIG